MLLSLSTPWGVFSTDLCSAVALWFALVPLFAVFRPVSISVSQRNDRESKAKTREIT